MPRGRVSFSSSRLSSTFFGLGLCVLGLLVFGGPGCSSRSESAPSSSASSKAAAAAPEQFADQTHALALTPPDGASAELVQLISKAKASTEKADPWILLGRAWVVEARHRNDPGFYLSANACADIALEIAPDSHEARNLQGLVMMNNHQFKEARDKARETLKIQARDPIAMGTLSDAELELGNYEAATDAVGKMMDIKPNLPSYSRTSYLRWLHGDVDGAIQTSRLAIDAGKGSHDVEPYTWQLTQAAIIFFQQGDLPGAGKGFDLALRSINDYPAALVGKARVSLANGEARAAAELLEKSFKESPLVETEWLLGDAQSIAGNQPAADAAYATAISEGKKSDKLTLARFYATKNRDLGEALKLIEEESKSRGGIYVDDVHGWVLYRQKNFDEAKKYAEKSLALGTKDARLFYHAGAIFLAAGDEKRGRKLIEDALELNPHFDELEAREAKSLIASK